MCKTLRPPLKWDCDAFAFRGIKTDNCRSYIRLVVLLPPTPRCSKCLNRAGPGSFILEGTKEQRNKGDAPLFVTPRWKKRFRCVPVCYSFDIFLCSQTLPDPAHSLHCFSVVFIRAGVLLDQPW